MRAYLWISGLIFAAIVALHVARIALENPQLATDFHFLLLTLVAAFLALWAGRLLWKSRRPS